MSDETSSWFQKHVEILEAVKRRTMIVNLKPEVSASIKHGLEVLSALLWVLMVLWIELNSIVIYFYIFVSKFSILMRILFHSISYVTCNNML